MSTTLTKARVAATALVETRRQTDSRSLTQMKMQMMSRIGRTSLSMSQTSSPMATRIAS